MIYRWQTFAQMFLDRNNGTPAAVATAAQPLPQSPRFVNNSHIVQQWEAYQRQNDTTAWIVHSTMPKFSPALLAANSQPGA